MEDLRFRSQQSPRHDNAPPLGSFVSPPRARMGQPQQQQQQQQQTSNATHDPRAGMPRRFTTDSGYVPTLSSITSSMQRAPVENGQDYKAMQQVQLIEKKKLEYERIKEQRARFERQMRSLEAQQRREALELAQMEEEASRLGLGGHQSEPTTPPEYRDHNREHNGFPSMFSRPNRYSTSALTSPPGLPNRPNRSGSQLASPPAGVIGGGSFYDGSLLPSRSVPGTRRNSDDEKDEAMRRELSSQRSGNAPYRSSMPPVNPRNEGYGLDQANITGFLFGDEDNGAHGHGRNGDATNFPTLVRRDDSYLSASSAALDLALSSSPAPESHTSRGWNSISRHRTQHSLSALHGNSTALTEDLGSIGTMGSRHGSHRNSVDLRNLNDHQEVPGLASPPSGQMQSPPRLQSSFSSNDVPTVRSTQGNMANNNSNTHAQQHFHNHNASMGRIPTGATSVRAGHSRELSSDSNAGPSREQSGMFQSFQSALQANAPAFSSAAATASLTSPSTTSSMGMPGMNNAGNFYPQNGYAVQGGQGMPQTGPQGNYGHMNMLANNMQQMNMNGMGPMNGLNGINGMNGINNMNGFNGMNGMNGVPRMNGMNGMGGNPQNTYTPQNYGGYGAPYNQPAPPPARDSQARVMQNRRQQDTEAMSRYQNMPLENFRNQIYSLCKDQHGCRYLQKKLEERDPAQVHMIWAETNEHVIELMMDPFGNYLCQKLLEFCNDDERTRLIENASRDMSRIALDQHGTRALQKMIEHVTTPQQVHLITEALRNRVVDLIQDLNGNHVIQKCLNKLAPADAQFIFDAVGQRCVEVGTHRHGCCVLQRCIDHADGEQKVWLIARITENARVLIQDPFGNYVVQYIIDLNEPKFTEPVVAAFQRCICDFSCLKFSSNVIEKCLRCAKGPSKDMIVQELLSSTRMEALLKDSYANYVIQTALDYATPQGKHNLVEAIRPLLPAIRGTPHGRRIQTKITAYDNSGSATTSGQATPSDQTQGQIPLRQTHTRAMPSNGGASYVNGTSSAQHNGNGLQGGPARAPETHLNGSTQLAAPPQINGQLPSQTSNGQMPPQAFVQQPQFAQQHAQYEQQAPAPSPGGNAVGEQPKWI